MSRAGRFNKCTKIQHGQEEGSRLFKNGYGSFVTWVSPHIAHVPSTSNMTEKYTVDIIRATCECPASNKGGEILYKYIISKKILQIYEKNLTA